MARTPIETHKRRQPDGTLPDISIYPEGENQAMPSFAHERAMRLINEVLIRLLAPISLVATELAVLWNRANLRDHLVPDLLVALEAGELDPVYGMLRRQYRIWDEAGPPDLVIEAASPSTLGRDNVGKKEDYAALGVPEYVQFNPLGELLQPGMQVYQLSAEQYQPVLPGQSGGVPSIVLTGYEWVQIGRWLRLRERATGRLAPTPEEVLAEETARAEAAEAEIARLRDELARLQRSVPPHAEPKGSGGDS